MSNKELKNIAPSLYQLKKMGSGFVVPNEYFNMSNTTMPFDIFNSNKQQVFKTPKNYFESVEEKVLNKIVENENSFSIPEGYFDSIEDKIFDKIYKKPKVISLKNRIIKQFIPIAAAASLLLFISLQFSNFNSVDTDLFTSIETSEIENWIENEDLDLNSYDIASIYEEDDLESLELNSFYDDDEMLMYLNDIDIESLITTN